MNTERYLYNGPPESRQAFEVLPEGDYDFEVLQADPPYQKNAKWVMRVRLVIRPSGHTVFASPWTGEAANGFRDQIAEFLHCVNRVPKVGLEPDWDNLVKASGTCHLAVEIASQGKLAGKEVNKVAYWHVPKTLEAEPPTLRPIKRPQDDEDDSLPF